MFGGGSYEGPAYTVIARHDAVEVRAYSPYLIARTATAGSFEAARSANFKRLADYIFGANRAQAKMSMTAPVFQQSRDAGGERMAMTAPVLLEPDQAEWVMAFVMPSKYRLQDVPEPLDDSIRIEEVPARTVAVLRYSGSHDQVQMARHTTALRAWLAEHRYTEVSPPQSAGYDPPWTVPWARRNEVHIAVSAPDPR